MEGEQETTEPASNDTKKGNEEDKEANGGDNEVKDTAGEIVKEAATAESPPADSEKEKTLQKIEQRPFLTQSELLIKMKAGEEEEVKRCQDLVSRNMQLFHHFSAQVELYVASWQTGLQYIVTGGYPFVKQ